MKKTSIKNIRQTSRKLLENSCAASTTPGEMTFNHVLPKIEAGPLKYLIRGIGGTFKSIPKVLKDKKRIILLLIISLIWLALMILSALGIKNPALSWLNFLTFARGGTEGDLFGITGGIIGKGLFAYFIISIVIPLFRGRKSFAGIKNGLKIFFRSFIVKEKQDYFFLLIGAGAAFLVYNFITVNASLQNSMAGIAALFISLKALSTKSSFMRGFIRSVLYKTGRKKITVSTNTNQIITGWVMGFALGIPLSITGINIIGYLTGFVLIVIAVIIKLISKNKKEVVAK